MKIRFVGGFCTGAHGAEPPVSAFFRPGQSSWDSGVPNAFDHIGSPPGMLTQGGQGGHPAPLASRLHRIPTHFLLSLHGI